MDDMPQSFASDPAVSRLRVFRAAHGLSQAALSKLADIDRVTISNVERGHSRPSRRTRRELAKALGVEPSAIWPDADGDGEGPDG